MKRRIILTIIVLLVLLLTGAATAALHTEVALRWALALIQNQSNGMLHIGSESGTLSGPITLHDVRLRANGFEASIRQVTLDWTPWKLFTNRLELDSLRADQVAVTLKPTSGHTPFRFVKPVPPRLPFAIIIEQLRINGMQVNAPQLQEPVAITHANAVARFDNRRWQITQLSIGGSEVQVHGHGDWQFREGEQLDAVLGWKLVLPGQAPLAGAARLNGDQHQMTFGMTLYAPLKMRLDAEVHDLFGAPSWRGRLTLGQVQLHDFDPALPAIALQTTAQFSGTPAATDFSGTLIAHEHATGDWQGRFALRYAGEKLHVNKLALARDSTGTRFQLAGDIDLHAAVPAPDLHGTWQNLPLPLTGTPWLTSPQGTLHVQSHAQNMTLKLDGALSHGGTFTAQGGVNMNAAAHPWQITASARHFTLAMARLPRTLPAFDWHLRAHGDREHTLIKHLGITGFGGNLSLSGAVAHGGSRTWHVTLSGQQLDPGVLFPHWQGAIGFKATLDGQQSRTPQWSLKLLGLQGTLRGAPVSASGRAHRAQGKLHFSNVEVHLANNRFRFSGHVGRNTHVVWDIAAPDLAALWPALSGALDSQGSIELDGDRPSARFSVHATRLRYRDNAIAALDATLDMRNGSQDGSASLKASNLRVAGETLQSLSAEAHGALDQHTVQLDLASAYGTLHMRGSGTLANDIWHGNLQNVTLQPAGAGVWQADGAWQPRIGADGVVLPRACLVQAAARACLDANWQRHTWRADASLSAIPLHGLAALLPPGLEYAGSFGGSLRADGDANGPHLDLDAVLSPGSIHNQVRHRRVTLLDYTHGDAHIHIDTARTTGTLHWTLRDGGYLDVDTRIAHDAAAKLSGHIRGELHDFALIPALIPDVSGFEGKFAVNLALGGSASDPTFTGSASLNNGAISVPRLGLSVTGVVLNLQGNGERLALSGQAQSGKGSLSWESDAQKRGGVWHASGKLNGTDFRVSDIPEAQVDISPALNFKLDGRDITLNGSVVIPYAKLRPRNLGNTAQVSDDQVIVGQNEASQKDRWRIHARVRASMGDKVDFSGFGLSGRITGSVLAVDEPGHFTTGSGELQIVDGQYTAYGQQLRIGHGRLMFNGGPISNPALDIRALRKPAHPETVIPGQSEQQVGVVVRGTLHDPSVSLFSNPPLPQSSLLSYLLTGQLPATPSQSPLLGQPSTDTSDALTYSGGEFLAQQLGNQIGLSDVSVQNVSTGAGTSTPSLFIGKYLSPRLYVSYGAGLLQSINTIRIRYTLGTKWMLEAESGAASSADIIYTLEH